MRARNWKAKAALQAVLSALPGGHRLNFLLQCATGGLPISDSELRGALGYSQTHLEAAAKWCDRPLRAARFFEFGAGWDLTVPLLFWSQGVEHQHEIDIRPLLRPRLVATAARRIGRLDANLIRVPAINGDELDVGELERAFGIVYDAPCDATATGLPPASFDVITSTNTLEHIPVTSIVPILNESRRLLAPGGILSFIIDYDDHYAYFDPTLSVHNFLRFDEKTWRRYNTPLHYQNRLRHDDYIDLFVSAGFTVVDETPRLPTPEDIATIRTIPLDARYSHLPLERLAIRHASVVLRAV